MASRKDRASRGIDDQASNRAKQQCIDALISPQIPRLISEARDRVSTPQGKIRAANRLLIEKLKSESAVAISGSRFEEMANRSVEEAATLCEDTTRIFYQVRALIEPLLAEDAGSAPPLSTRPRDSTVRPDLPPPAPSSMPIEEVPYAAMNVAVPPGGESVVAEMDQQIQISEALQEEGAHEYLARGPESGEHASDEESGEHASDEESGEDSGVRRGSDGERPAEGGSGSEPGSEPASRRVEEARQWMARLNTAVTVVARSDAKPMRKKYASRHWKDGRVLSPSEVVRTNALSKQDIPTTLPPVLATIRVEPPPLSADARDLAVMGEAPDGMDAMEAARREREGEYSTWRVRTALRNMFVQSGIPHQMKLKMHELPDEGLCVWLATALLLVRHESRERGGGSPPLELTVGCLRDTLTDLKKTKLPNDKYLKATLDYLNTLGTKEAGEPWSTVSGEEEHYGNIHDVWEVLADALGVHVPILALYRDDDTVNQMTIALYVYGQESAPSIFGSHGGALVIYDVQVKGNAEVSHVDVLLPNV